MADTSSDLYRDFTDRLKLFTKKHPDLMSLTLSNIFTMRLVGNKTHGDLAEIAIAEFINQYMYDFRSVHVGKDLYRAKSREEDVKIINELSGAEIPVSLKAYGDGPLQLSTDKNFLMFPRLEREGGDIYGSDRVREVLSDSAFRAFNEVNVLPLIYDEKKQKCNIMVYDYRKAVANTVLIKKEIGGRGRKHAVYRFYDNNNSYICEVRYGDAQANALQRGLWTNTKNAITYFDSMTYGWIDYSHNLVLVKLLSHALVSTEEGHKKALEVLLQDIQLIKQGESIG